MCPGQHNPHKSIANCQAWSIFTKGGRIDLPKCQNHICRGQSTLWSVRGIASWQACRQTSRDGSDKSSMWEAPMANDDQRWPTMTNVRWPTMEFDRHAGNRSSRLRRTSACTRSNVSAAVTSNLLRLCNRLGLFCQCHCWWPKKRPWAEQFLSVAQLSLAN